MTVAEYIEELLDLPQDAQVVEQQLGQFWPAEKPVRQYLLERNAQRLERKEEQDVVIISFGR